MSEVMIFRTGLLLWAAFAAAAAVWVFTLREANSSGRMAVARSRVAGGISGGLALALTVPQISVLLWSWLVPWYVPLIALFLILSIIYIDFPGSRGIAGIVLISAYYFLYYSFALQMPCAAAGSIFCWCAAIWGIAISARPCWMRDQIQWLARHTVMRILTAAVLALSAVYCIYGSTVL